MGGKMNRQKLAAYITDTYGVNGAHLFARYPNFQVFRHAGNKKWFAVLMDIPRRNLGLTGDGEISVVNLKCDTRLTAASASTTRISKSKKVSIM
jgi:predicted DNA-binding protein (MmcQ/YjbR family)